MSDLKVIIMKSERIDLVVEGRRFEFYMKRAKHPNKPILFVFHGHGYNKKIQRNIKVQTGMWFALSIGLVLTA